MKKEIINGFVKYLKETLKEAEDLGLKPSEFSIKYNKAQKEFNERVSGKTYPIPTENVKPDSK